MYKVAERERRQGLVELKKQKSGKCRLEVMPFFVF